MTDHVFISYCREDKAYARRLVEAIESEGFSVWMDERIMAGAKWRTEIEKKLENCMALVVLASTHSRESDWVDSEIQHAAARGKKIIPLLVDIEEPWLSLRAFNCVDVTNGDLPPKSFYDDLRKYSTLRPGPEADTGVDRQERKAALDGIIAAKKTAFECRKCKFPVAYDTVTGVAMVLLFGVPAIGAAVMHYLLGWVGAIVFCISAFVLISILISTGGDWFREPSRCPKCQTRLTKPLTRYREAV